MTTTQHPTDALLERLHDAENALREVLRIHAAHQPNDPLGLSDGRECCKACWLPWRCQTARAAGVTP